MSEQQSNNVEGVRATVTAALPGADSDDGTRLPEGRGSPHETVSDGNGAPASVKKKRTPKSKQKQRMRNKSLTITRLPVRSPRLMCASKLRR